MADIVYWGLVQLGLIYFVTESVFFSPFRRVIAALGGFFMALIYCAACSGFWIGLVRGALADPMVFSGDATLDMIAAGVVGMAIGAVWGAIHHNPAFTVEQPYTPDGEGADDTP